MPVDQHASPRRRLSAFEWGGQYFGCYLIFVTVYSVLRSFSTDFLTGAPLGDAGLAALSALYGFLVFILFMFFGWWRAGSAPPKLWKRLLAVSSVTIPGILGWWATCSSAAARADTVLGLPWIGYKWYQFWAYPVLEVMMEYVPDTRTLQLWALAAAFLPAAGAMAGIQAYRWVHREGGSALATMPIKPSSPARSTRKLVWALAVLPAVLTAVVIGSSVSVMLAPFTKENYPKVDGATAAIPFGRILVQRLTGVSVPLSEKRVRFNTTHTAYVNLIEGKADLIFAAGPSDEELELAREKGVELKLTPVGKDAFVFLVHRDNPVQGLTAAQLKDIYSGKINGWDQVGGEKEPVLAFQREANSGSQTYMEKQVMKGTAMAEPPMNRKVSGMGELIETVADYRNAKQALGYSFLYYAMEMNRREEIKLLAVDGAEPNHAHILDGSYPFTAILYAVTREDERAGSPANKLLQWLATEEGSRAVEDGGYVPVRPEIP